MEKKKATDEIEYRLAKWLISNLKNQGHISADEETEIIQILLKEYQPICACLEEVVMPDE